MQDGLYNLYPVTKTMFVGVIRPDIVDCFSLCDILRENLTIYLDHINKYILKNETGIFYGCICS